MAINKRPIIIRRVVGVSMAPKLEPGQLILAWCHFRELHPGQVVVLKSYGKELIKRIERFDKDKVYVIGDNPGSSTDSRQFGWLDEKTVVARVFWPKLAK